MQHVCVAVCVCVEVIKHYTSDEYICTIWHKAHTKAKTIRSLLVLNQCYIYIYIAIVGASRAHTVQAHTPRVLARHSTTTTLNTLRVCPCLIDLSSAWWCERISGPSRPGPCPWFPAQIARRIWGQCRRWRRTSKRRRTDQGQPATYNRKKNIERMCK